jgi:gas vesicle protein
VDDVLGRVGLARNRSHVGENLAYLGAGVLVGAGAALLLAPMSGSDTRARLGRKIDELGEAAANAVEAVENKVPGLRGQLNEMANERQHH